MVCCAWCLQLGRRVGDDSGWSVSRHTYSSRILMPGVFYVLRLVLRTSVLFTAVHVALVWCFTYRIVPSVTLGYRVVRLIHHSDCSILRVFLIYLFDRCTRTLGAINNAVWCCTSLVRTCKMLRLVVGVYYRCIVSIAPTASRMHASPDSLGGVPMGVAVFVLFRKYVWMQLRNCYNFGSMFGNIVDSATP